MTRGQCASLAFTVTDLHRLSPAGLPPAHRGSMAGLCIPLPTLRPYPRRHLRTARADAVRYSFIVADFHRFSEGGGISLASRASTGGMSTRKDAAAD